MTCPRNRGCSCHSSDMKPRGPEFDCFAATCSAPPSASVHFATPSHLFCTLRQPACTKVTGCDRPSSRLLMRWKSLAAADFRCWNGLPRLHLSSYCGITWSLRPAVLRDGYLLSAIRTLGNAFL